MVSCKRGAFNDTLCLGNLFRIDKKKGTIIIYKNKECFKHVWSSSTKSIIAFDVSPVCTTCAAQTHTQNTSINTLNLPFSHNSQKISGEKYWNREKSNFTGDPPGCSPDLTLKAPHMIVSKCLLLLLTNYLHISIQT